MLEVAMTGQTSYRLAADMNIARRMNKEMGTTIGFWEVGQFDYTTLEYFRALGNQLPTMQAGVAKIRATEKRIHDEFYKGRKH